MGGMSGSMVPALFSFCIFCLWNSGITFLFTMKKLNGILKFLFSLLVATTLFACDTGDNSFDDEEKENNSQTSLIQGIWKYKFDSGASFYVFNNDGSGYYIELDPNDGYKPGGYVYMDPFSYLYDEQDNLLLIVEYGELYEYIVKKLTSIHMTFIDPDGYVLTYVKYNGDLDDIKREYNVDLKVYDNR